MVGVVSVGEVPNTALPEPVSFVKAVASCADVKEPKELAFPTEVTAPVRLALVVTLVAVVAVVAVAALPPIESPAAVPVQLVNTPAEGVPKFGVTKTGEIKFALSINSSYRAESPAVVPAARPVNLKLPIGKLAVGGD